MQLDEFDIRLLEALQEDNQLSASELADQARLSPGSCLRRIKRMREEGVIAKDVSILNPEAVGRKLTMFVLVSLERERVDLIDFFFQAEDGIRDHCVTGVQTCALPI